MRFLWWRRDESTTAAAATGSTTEPAERGSDPTAAESESDPAVLPAAAAAEGQQDRAARQPTGHQSTDRSESRLRSALSVRRTACLSYSSGFMARSKSKLLAENIIAWQDSMTGRNGGGRDPRHLQTNNNLMVSTEASW